MAARNPLGGGRFRAAFNGDAGRGAAAPHVARRADPPVAAAGRGAAPRGEPHRAGRPLRAAHRAHGVAAALVGGRPAQARLRRIRTHVLDAVRAAQAQPRRFPATVLRNAMVDFLSEMWRFLKARKKLWLLPVILAMIILGGLLVLAQGSVVAPFIYTLF